MTGAANHQLAVRAALQHAALKIEAARRFLQAGGGAHAQAHRLSLPDVAGQLRQQRLNQLVEGQRCGNRVARQAAEPAVAKLAESERFSRFDRQLPEADFPQLFENRFGVVRFADGNAAGANHHIGLLVSLNKGFAQFSRVVGNNAEVNHFAAQLLQHQVYRQAVGIVNLPIGQRLARQLKFIAGGEHRHPHFTHHVNLGNAQRGDDRQLGGGQACSRGEDDRAMGDIFAETTDILPAFHRGDKADPVIGLFGLLLHDHRVAAFRYRRASHNADTGARRPDADIGLTGEGLARYRQRCAVGEIRQAYGVAVHCRVIKTGHVERRNEIMGGYARKGLQQRYGFRRIQRRNTSEHLGQGCVERHQSGGKIHGFLLRANIENAYYGRKVRAAICHLGTGFTSPSALSIFKNCIGQSAR